MVRLDSPRPEPWQVGHGSSTTRPRPPQAGQVSFIVKAPPTEAARMPTPSHCGHTCGTVPARAPVPLQSPQGASEESRSEMVTPSTASVKPIVASVSMSAPRRGAAWRVPRPPPNTDPKRSPKPPDAVVVPPPNRSLTSKGRPPGWPPVNGPNPPA